MSKEIGKAEWPRQIIGAVIMGGLVVVTGYLIFITYYKSAIIEIPWYPLGNISLALFAVSGILFGIWGVIAVYFGEMMVLSYSYPTHVSQVISISAILQALIPALAFKYLKADPRLKTGRDVFIFSAFGVVLNSLATTLIASSLWVILGLSSWRFMFLFVMQRWVVLSLIFIIIFGFPLLWLLSRIAIKARAYCKGWFS